MTNNFHDLITRMANELDEYRRLLLDDCTVTHRLSNEARAALADEPAVPEPATWTEGVCGDGAVLLKDGVMVPIEAVVRELNEGARARAVLARWGNPGPQPVPVSERPWEREGWCDTGGLCWLGSDALDGCTPTWLYGSPAWAERFPSVHRVSLPAHALPLPEVGE